MKFFFQGTADDLSYISRFKSILGTNTAAASLQPVLTISQIEMACKRLEIQNVVSTSKPLLKKLLGLESERKDPSLKDYQGSMISRNGINYLFIQPLEQFQTVNYSSFLVKRFLTKYTSPEKWFKATAFNWKLLTPANIQEYHELFKEAIVIGVDIETAQNPLRITCVSYTAVFSVSGTLESISLVLPIDSQWAVSWMRKFNWELPAPKVFQNGKYDNAYFFYYSAPIYNYLFDTANAMHCWYSELPKDLGFINAFFIREAIYYKDLAKTSDLQQYYRYNALDSWATVNSFLAWLEESPDWAKRNYLLEFPLVFPCHMAEMRGIKRDIPKLHEQNKKFTEEITTLQKSLAVMTATPTFNANSPKQVCQLLEGIGCKDIAEKGSGEIQLKKAIYRHPLNARILNTILKIREKRKLVSTYLGVGVNADGDSIESEFHGNRILYSLNPHGTDTGRLASKEHHFWCGLQIHNISRGPEVKCTLIADDGFVFAEIDEKQAETWDTAYISGESNLIKAVSDPNKDFHSINVSAFFGQSYDDIWDSVKKKSKNKELRDIGKRVNHGANYVMGAGVLLDVMGIEEVEKARSLLKLPKRWAPIDITEHLLKCFHKTYPGLEKDFYTGVIAEVLLHQKLISPQGWTRWCFGRPDKVKSDKNAYIAHVPQNCNAMRLNKAYMRIFYEVALHPEYKDKFKLGPQVHDSTLNQYRKDSLFLIQKVAEIMTIETIVKSYDKVVRKYTVPVDIKAGKDGLGSYRWSECDG